LNDLNRVEIEGNIVQDPVFRNTPDGTTIASFSVATNRYYKKGDEPRREASYIDIEAWGRLGENCKTLAHKGRGCRVYGRLKQERWDGPDGSRRQKVIIIAKEIEYKAEKPEGDR
jgi:single-strand DNA-binding protein